MYRNIVVGTDFSDTAAQAVEHAAGIAEAFGATLHVVTGFRSSLSSSVPVSALEALAVGAAADLVQQAETKIGEEVDQALRAIGEELAARGISVRAHARGAEPADALIDVAENEKADLIVVGNRGMGGVKRFVLGSVPNKITHHAPCSVLVVHTT